MRRLATVRARISLVMLIMVLVPTLIAGALTYWTASQVIAQEKIRSVGTIADVKKELLLFRLHRQSERNQELLAVVQARCSKNGRLTAACARAQMAPVLPTLFALDALLILPDGNVLEFGDEAKSLQAQAPTKPGQMAQFSSRLAPRPNYVMSAHASGMTLHIRFRTHEIETIFSTSPGLGSTGETFLADSQGNFLTSPRYHSVHSSDVPIDATPMQTCLTGKSGQMLADDYQPASVIHGFRSIPEIGGGCIMAHISQEEAFLPLKTVRKRIALLVVIFAVAAMVFSYWIAHVFSRQFTEPLRRLVDRILSAQAGDLDSPVPTAGPKEISTLGQGFTELIAQLKKNIQVREDFVAIASHDLKNPISSLGLALSIMERQLETETQDLRPGLLKQISLMRQVLTKMTELINAVLNLTAIRSGRFTLHYQIQNLNQMIQSTVETFRPIASDRGLNLNLNLPPEPQFARVDPNRLSQVLSNFLGNAPKFTPRGGTITLSLCEAGGRFRFSVTDTGPGLAPESLERIFERFTQGQRTGDFSVGLGLYIAKEIISAHGGRIWAESTPGHGAQFYFEVPGSFSRSGAS